MYNRNDFKLRFNDYNAPRFFVNKQKGVVVCKMDATLYTPTSMFDDIHIPERFFTGVGIAKCSPDDIFDEARGKKIAMAKAENDAYRQAVRFMDEQLNKLKSLITAADNFKAKAEACHTHNLDYIESLHNPEHEYYKAEVKDVTDSFTLQTA